MHDIAWALQKHLDGRSVPPTWATVERSPEEGAMKRAMKIACEAAQNVCGDRAIVDATETVWLGGQEARRWNASKNVRKKRKAWQQMSVNLTWTTRSGTAAWWRAACGTSDLGANQGWPRRRRWIA